MPNDYLNKKDIEIFIDVNKKSIELNTLVASQNEEVLNDLESLKENQKEILRKIENVILNLKDMDKIRDINDKVKDIEKIRDIDKSSKYILDNTKDMYKDIKDNSAVIQEIKKQNETLDRTFFEIKLLLGTSFLGIVIQVIQIILQYTKK